MRIFFTLLMLLLLVSPAGAGRHTMGFFVDDSDAYTCMQAIKDLDFAPVEFGVFTREEIYGDQIEEFIRRMDIAVVDIMPRQPAQWLLSNRDAVKPAAKIYAVGSSNQTQEFQDAGFIIDQTVQSYFQFTSAANLRNLILLLARRDLNLAARYDAPLVPPANSLYHPDAPQVFADLPEYMRWYRQSGRYKAGKPWDLTLIYPTFAVDAKKGPVDALIRAYEKNGINAITLLQAMQDWDQTLESLISSAPLKSHLGSITGFTFKFSSRLSSNGAEVLQRADVPVFNPQYLFFSTAKEWRASDQGIAPQGVAFQFGVPEISGLVEPSLIGVKERAVIAPHKAHTYRYVPLRPSVEKLARRAARWHRLQQMANEEKKVVLVYYNHGGGKQNIGASYLNVFRSLREIIHNLKQAGYAITGDPSEDKIRELLIKSGRNIGSWAPDELHRLIREGNIGNVSLSQYKRWLAEIGPDFKARLEKAWGQPEDSSIMIKDGKFVLPFIKLGNLILTPQPSRGWSDDPEKLLHSPTLYPHHQYAAFYLWLQKVIKPDVMISLGTHGTHEWLPGKDAGLSASCPPEVLIGDIPNLYPYIVDNVGEGIQAKRRGRGVIIDHATPPFKKGGIYEEYSQLAMLISEYQSSASGEIQAAKLERIGAMTAELGLGKDLDMQIVDEAALDEIEHYLLQLKTEMIPYGLHTFGISPVGEGLEETAAAIAAKGGQSAEFYKTQLSAAGPSEMASLMRGMRGGYIPSASGNDPIRNPESLPTGKNFYGFDPDKIPSREAWKSGKKAADQLIDAYRKKHAGKYPEQIGVILWSVETIRNEGINTATALWLLGMKPVWSQRDKVTGVVPVAGKELGRPRIDLLLQMSALFRDTFPTTALMLDGAVKEAAALTDVKNFVKKHTQQIRKQLTASGFGDEEAQKRSTVRLFSAKPGVYGTKVAQMVGSSGLWEDDKIVAGQGFVNMVSHGYSADIWGQPLQHIYRQNLKQVDATIHTISSNLYATMDNDDVFQYLGGLSMAVREESGRDPDVYLSMQKDVAGGHIEPIYATIGRELRSRYLNPKWIAGMKNESYAGAREMAEFLENMWGWQVTTPKAIDKTKWEQSYDVYVEDKYGLGLKAFFNKHNPWAYQSMTARMLEATRKDYWQADENRTRKLAVEYALNVVARGVACCDHTCNNPLLNKMVVNIISLPGVLAAKVVEKFKLAVEKAAQKSLDDQVAARSDLLARLNAGLDEKKQTAQREARKNSAAQEQAKGREQSRAVEGYKMEEIDTLDETTDLSSSGIQWAASLFLLLLMGFFVLGLRQRS